MSGEYVSPIGTVVNVEMTGDGVIFNTTVPGSPISIYGTLAPALKTQAAGTFLAGPISGGNTTPTFRIITVTDLFDGTGASSSTFLRGDGSWSSLPIPVPGGSTGQMQYNNGVFAGASGIITPDGNSLYIKGPIPFTDPRAFGATGNGSTDDTAALQAAISATPSGGWLFLSHGTYLVSSTLYITSPINFIGGGKGSIIYVSASFSDTEDVFSVNPTSDGSFLAFKEFQILPVSGTPSRYAFNFNGASSDINNLIIDHITIQQLGSYGIYFQGSGDAQGTPATSTVQNSVIVGGIVATNAGDTVRIINNVISGTGKCDFSFQAGASTLLFKGNNCTVSGGIHLGTEVVSAQFIENEFETEVACTEVNGAYLDIDGTSGSNTNSVIISRNSFQLTAFDTIGIRVNYANSTNIFGNVFERGVPPAVDILVTANATGTLIGTNAWTSGGPYLSMIADSSSTTIVSAEIDWVSNGALLFNNSHGLAWVDETDTPRLVLNTAVDGSVNLYGYHGGELLVGVSGANYLYDPNTTDIALEATNAISNSPSTGTVISVASFYTRVLSLGGSTSGVISILPQTAAGTYNFNLPTTAGTTGQLLTSAGGGSSPMTWTTVNPILSGTTSSIGGSILAPGGCSSGTASVTGATTSMVVTATPASYPGNGCYWAAYVSSPGTVTVQVCAVVSVTPGASVYNVRVIQ
jgi:hypothetical protein